MERLKAGSIVLEWFEDRGIIMKKLIATALFGCTLSSQAVATDRPLLSVPQQDNFFSTIAKLCGTAYEGRVVSNDVADEKFASQRLVMHVRRCSDTVLEIPFHVGADASRTWVISKTGSGLQLKHDHRHEDGSNDELTMYGGHTIDAGFDQAQSFPADAPTKQMFAELGIPQSNGNTWQFYVYPKVFTYRMVRDGREFKVDFDLTKPVNTPAAPWGYSD